MRSAPLGFCADRSDIHLPSIRLRVPVRPRVIDAVANGILCLYFAPLEEALDVGDMGRVVRTCTDNNGVEVLRCPGSFDTLALLEILQMARSQVPDGAFFRQLLDARGIRMYGRPIVGV